MKNYYITENNEKIEIIDEERIDLSGCNFATKCKYSDLRNNNLTKFNINLPNCKQLYLDKNNLTSFNADLPNCKTLYLSHNSLTYKRFNNNITFYI